MKILKDCKLCNNKFKISKSSKIITCDNCRKENNHILNWKKRNDIIISKFNENFNLLRIHRTSGRYKISNNFENYDLKNSISNLTNKKLYKEYLFDLLYKIEQDLILIEGYKFN